MHHSAHSPSRQPDLLAFFVGSPGIGQDNFVDHTAQLDHLRGNLRLESEAVVLNRDLVKNLAAKELVANLDVGCTLLSTNRSPQ